jgi:2-dehydro-3-deoxyphosphogluconate aldolase / (4S)-4-hydroxy-2-oxoglutarate aldolase
MNKNEVCGLIRDIGIIPAIKVASIEDAHFATDAVCHAGIPIVEITMAMPGAVGFIAHLARYHPKVLIGAGTVLDTETARQCVDAGARFLTSPGFELELVEFASKEDIAVLPGALTPTEVLKAWKAGSDFIKVFPCAQVGGESYIRALKTALPQVPLIAAGGVNQQTAASFILSGATAIGVGTELIPSEAIQRRQSKRIRELALRFTGFVKQARDLLEEGRKSAAPAKPSAIEECEKTTRP